MSVFNKMAEFVSEDHKETDELGITLEDIREICSMHTALCKREEAERHGYRYCKVDSVISGMNGLYTKVKEYATAGEVVEDCIDVLKEACL